MNTRFSYALAASLMAFVPAAWAAQQAPDPPKVTVAQARTVRMAPKIALPERLWRTMIPILRRKWKDASPG